MIVLANKLFQVVCNVFSFHILTSETRSQYRTIVLRIIIKQKHTEKHKDVKTDGGHSTELKCVTHRNAKILNENTDTHLNTDIPCYFTLQLKEQNENILKQTCSSKSIYF